MHSVAHLKQRKTCEDGRRGGGGWGRKQTLSLGTSTPPGFYERRLRKKRSPHLYVEAPEVLVVVELLGRGEFSPENVQLISEERRLVGTPRGGRVGRLDLAPLVLLDVPPGGQAGGVKQNVSKSSRSATPKVTDDRTTNKEAVLQILPSY